MTMLHALAALLPKAPPLTSIAFQTSATSKAQTITCPTIQQNDVAILFDATGNNSGTVSNAIPSGFTQLQTSAGSLVRVTASYKVLDGSESGASFSGMTGNHMAKVLLIFRPDSVVSSVATSTFLEEMTNGNPAAQTIAASGQTPPLIRLAAAAQNEGVTPTFTDGTFDATVGEVSQFLATSVNVGYAVQNSSPSDDAVDLGDAGNFNCLMSGWVRFS
jgi:hypothetical protein